MNAKCNFIKSILCFLALLHAAQPQKKTNPTRLTGLGKNLSTIPVALLDQCFPYEESKTFGIEFRLPRTGGRCDDGLIICYTGSLATRTLDNVHSMNGLSVNSKLFNVDNAVNNSLAKYCTEAMNVSWHGIKVHTEKSSGKSIIKLSTSLLEDKEQSFEIPDAQRQFIIHFGNKNEFSAYLTVEGKRIDLDVEKAKQYMKLAPKGAHLKDFVGFWTLGLDMLPWMDHEVELYVNRTCSCTMEAWFILPTDLEEFNDPDMPTSGLAGDNCPKNTDITVPLNKTLQANHMILIRMLTDEQIQNVSFEILAASESGIEAPLMAFTISKSGADICYRVNKAAHFDKPFDWVFENVHLPEENGSRQIDFIIALTEYSYGIVMNKRLLGGQEFYPANWAKGLPFNDMTSLRVRGQFLLLKNPLPVMSFNYVQQNYEPQIFHDIFIQSVPDLHIGDTLTFRIKTHNLRGDRHFTISLLHNRPLEEHKTIGATALRMRVWHNQIEFKSFIEHHGTQTRNTTETTINTGAMEFRIELLRSNGYEIFKDNKPVFIFAEHLPVWAIDYIRVSGSEKGVVELLGEPFIGKEISHDKDRANFTQKLNTLLNYGDKILIDAQINKTTQSFAILLLHEALKETTKIGDVVLKLEFNFNHSQATDDCNGTVQCKSLLHTKTEDGKWTNMSNATAHRLNKYGQKFTISIKCMADNFTIQIDDVAFQLNCPYPKERINTKEVDFPPWAVDHIRIGGQVAVHSLSVKHEQNSIVDPFKKQINESNGFLQNGDLISVKIPIKIKNWNDSFSVTINLYNEGLGWNPIIGKAILNVTFNETKAFYLSSYDDGDDEKRMHREAQQKCPITKLNTTELKELDFQIRVIDNRFHTDVTGFNVKFNNMDSCSYNYSVASWAVQYITIVYEKVELGTPGITCVPEERCMGQINQTEDYCAQQNCGVRKSNKTSVTEESCMGGIHPNAFLGTGKFGHQEVWAPEVWAPGSLGTRSLGTGKFGHQEVWAPEVWAPGSLGTRKFGHREVWAPGSLGTRSLGTGKFGHQEVWAPEVWAPGSLGTRKAEKKLLLPQQLITKLHGQIMGRNQFMEQIHSWTQHGITKSHGTLEYHLIMMVGQGREVIRLFGENFRVKIESLYAEPPEAENQEFFDNIYNKYKN
uniref:Galectin domain-containing protein n=1 Tax=Globodera rostochiensis TaxID=31243 RepID=A0A914HLK0_GLORO